MSSDFHLSIDWGNVATVLVAITAIIVSARFNVLTLRSAGARFKKERQDAQNDKLRMEIAALLGALGERRAQTAIFNKRVRELLEEATVEETWEQALKRAAQNARVLMSQQVSPIHNRADGHAFAIFTLTSDDRVTGPVKRIQRTLSAEQSDFAAAIALYDRGAELDELLEESKRGSEAQQQHRHEIDAATDDLTAYCIENLRG